MDVSGKETKLPNRAGWAHSPFPIPELDLEWELGVGNVLVSGL